MSHSVLGIHLMKLFLCDLLGRDTVEAKIFQQAVEKELPTTRVVPLWAKVLAIVVIIGLNFYFIFAAILYGKDKNDAWQRMWLLTFFFNLAFDILVNNTLEVIIKEYFIPCTIKGRAISIKTKLDGIITTITKTNSVSSVGFSVPDYFFVSTLIARRIPELVESKIIMAYTATTPHDISASINKALADNFRNSRGVPSLSMSLGCLRMITSSIVLIVNFLLIQLGLLPDFIQVLVLRVLQPLVIAGFIYFFTHLIDIKVIYVVGVIPIYGIIITTIQPSSSLSYHYRRCLHLHEEEARTSTSSGY